MSDETKKLIEDLKAIRLELFRSAANLDDTITQLEISMSKETDADSIRRMVDCLCSWRRTMRVCRDLKKLDELETETWTKLIDSVK